MLGMKRAFVMTSIFDSSWTRMGLGDEELEKLQDMLLQDPAAGDGIPEMSGARKVRIPLGNSGKRGGGRVIYVDVVIRERIYLLLAYPKNVQTDLTDRQKKELRKLVKAIKEERIVEEFDFYEELKQSLEQAVAYTKGDRSHCRISVREIPVPEYKADDVSRTRKELNLSQRGFANALGVSKRTVEAWEAGVNTPSGAAQHLLYLLDNDHSLVERLVMK